MRIPIENIYYLLCYAWNKLPEKERISITVEDTTELVDLFAKIIIKATRLLIRRGLSRNYKEKKSEIQGLKGKLLLNDTLKAGLLIRQKTRCEYDEFSTDIVLNRILVTTIYRLIKTTNLSAQNRKELITLSKSLDNISLIDLNPSLFRRIRLNPNDRFYSFLMNVCELVYSSLLPTEKEGEFLFTSFEEDEAKMAILFESFIRNFYQIEQNIYKVRREDIRWNLFSLKNEDEALLPKMQTDITLEGVNTKIVIDAKYYQETMSDRFGAEKVKSANLYQLFSYLLNQEDGSEKTMKATGILIYPTIEKEYNLEYTYNDHAILIRTVNLNMHWKKISERLLEVIDLEK